jgi:RNA polymerase sigma-70 factor (ECF subfamily)
MMLVMAASAEPGSVAARTVDELWIRHRDELLRFATVLAGPADAYDIVADAFLRAAEPALRREVENPRAYLFRAVANAAASRHRSDRRRWERDLAAVGQSASPAPEEYSDVRKAVAALTPAQRAVVYLAFWEDMPERSIALFLGQSPGTVHRTLERAKRLLRKALS